jgi:uncharacterized membrane protein
MYLWLKALHVVSVALFLGNIITGVFWKWHADCSGELRARAQALEGIIRSDAVFTIPGVLLIIVTGVWMAIDAGLPLLRTDWILWSIVAFTVSGVTFAARVGPLQKKLLANTRAGLAGQWNQSEYQRMSQAWQGWGLVATAAPLLAVFLMVLKPDW